MIQRISYFTLLFGLLCFASPSAAQPLIRTSVGSELNTTVGMEYFLNERQKVYFRGNTAWVGDGRVTIGSSPWAHRSLQLGYEHWFGQHWAAGGLYSAQRFASIRLNEIGGYAQHTGKIGEGWFLLKKLKVAYRDFNGADREREWAAEGQAYLGRRFEWLSHWWQAGLSLQANRLLPQGGDNRNISQTRLSMQLDFPVGSRAMVRVYAQRYTQYFFGLAQERFDADGNLIESIPYHRLNRVTPVWGMQLRYFLGEGRGMPNSMPFVFFESR